MADSTGDPVVGATLAGYRIEGRLGRGGMSVVYLARDLALGRLIALKVLAPELSDDPRFRERLRVESRLAASIDHPNVIPIYEAGEAGGQFYIAMRYVEGTDLRRLISEQGPLEPARAAELVAHVADGLDAAHTRGLVHRDVKPSNILIASPGDHEHVYLADFGLTKAESEDEARDDAPTLSGTTDYVAPELITDAHAGIGADIYALGCVLYEALTGHVPFPRGSELETLAAHLDEPVPKPSEGRTGLPGALDTVVARAMAKDPGERYTSAAELAAAVRTTLPSQARSRRLPVLLAAGVAVVASAALAFVLLTRSDGAGLPAPTTEVTGSALQLIDPATSSLASTVKLLDPADDLAVTNDAVWLVDSTGGTITRFDPQTLETARVTPGPLQVEGIGVGFGSVWTTTNQPRQAAPPEDTRGGGLTVGLTALDPETLTERAVEVREYPYAFLDEVVASDTALWTADVANRTLERVDPDSGRVARIQLNSVPISLAAFGPDVWVAQPRVLSRVDASTGRLVAETPLAFTPSAIAADASGVWLADRQNDTVWLYDRRARRTVAIEVGDAPLDVTAVEGEVWVANGGDASVMQIDPDSRRVVSIVGVGANPVAIAIGEDGVWVAVRGAAAGPIASFPKVFVYGPSLLEFRAFLPGKPGERCEFGLPVRDCIGVSAGAMRGLDGTEATWVDAFRERRRLRSGSMVCGEKSISGPVTSNIRGNAGSSIVQVDGWGAAMFSYDRSRAVFQSMIATLPGGPDCSELAGRWIGVSGRLAGARGAWGPPVTKLPAGNLGGLELFVPRS